MNSYLNADMHLSIKTFAALANFLQIVGLKDMDANSKYRLQAFLFIRKNHYLRQYAYNRISVRMVFLFVFPQLPSTDYHLSTLITSHLPGRRISSCSKSYLSD